MSVYYEVDGVTVAPGSPAIATATVIPVSSVSSPMTEGTWWFKFHCTHTGLFYFSGYDLGTNPVTNNLYRSAVTNPTTMGDLTLLDSRSSGGLVGDILTAGTTYMVSVVVGSGGIGYIVTSSYQSESSWVQDPDQVIVTDIPNMETPGSGPHCYGSTPTPFWNVSGTPGSLLSAGKGGSNVDAYQGSYTLDHGFSYVVWPSEDSSAATCAWAHARKGGFGSRYWTTDGLHGDGSVTSGPVCVWTTDGSDAGQSFDNSGIGVTYGVSVALGGHQTIHYSVFGIVQRVNLQSLLDKFGPLAGQDPAGPTPPTGFEDGIFDHEDYVPTLTKVEVTPMETTAATRSSIKQVPQWSFKAVSPMPGDTGRSEWGSWGPKDDGTYNGWQGSAGDDGLLDAFLDNEDMRLSTTTYTGSTPTGGHVAENWEEIDPTLVALALAYEEAADPDDFDYGGGLRFVGLPGEIDGGAPVPVGTYSRSTSGDESCFTDEQCVILRLTLTPTRYRWILNPELPTPEALEPATWALTAGPKDLRRRFW